ncbi:MAG TPA: hypothetical protein VGM06_18825 [Polyangiaceae bacterium]|jgi:hypothetical protein
MDAIANIARPDVVLMETAPRPTATPVRVSFSQVLSAGANGLVQGAELAASVLPGSSLAAAAVRGGLSALSSPVASAVPTSLSPEGPGVAGTSTLPTLATGATGVSGTATDPTGSIDASLQQSAQMNLYYLQIQQQVDSQNRTFTTLSNVLKTEHDSAKGAIGNIHS